MNILCGIYEQTSGSIKIFNYESKDHFHELRQWISYCPQRSSFEREGRPNCTECCIADDILFDWLTVEEQIEFHARARGATRAVTSERSIHFSAGYVDEQEEICSDLLKKVNLENERKVFCKDLSGGMKRRLSLACAFIGQTRLVLLGDSSLLSVTLTSPQSPLFLRRRSDEPSSGLDPINRRLLW